MVRKTQANLVDAPPSKGREELASSGRFPKRILHEGMGTPRDEHPLPSPLRADPKRAGAKSRKTQLREVR